MTSLDLIDKKLLCLIRSQPTVIRNLAKFVNRDLSSIHTRLIKLEKQGYLQRKGRETGKTKAIPFTLTVRGEKVIKDYSLFWENEKQVATMGQVLLK